MIDPSLPAATVVIDRWSSTCNNCGKGADPNEDSHKTVLGYSVLEGEKEGCGIVWKFAYDNYSPGDGLYEIGEHPLADTLRSDDDALD
jgi:hypothetical protein